MHFEWNTGPYQGALIANSQFEVLPFIGLTVYVKTAEGLPAAYAQVHVMADDYSYSSYGYTGAAGYATMNVPPGKYNIVAYSDSDNFMVYKGDVTSPGTTTLSAVGTPEITVTATKKDGSPLDQFEVSVGVSNLDWAYGYVGFGDSIGQITFHVTPDIYDVGVQDGTNYYALYKVDQDLHSPRLVTFDMSVEPSAELVAGHPNDDLATLYLCPEANLSCGSTDNAVDGIHIVLTPGLGYRPYQIIQRDDLAGNLWNYEFTTSEPINLAPDEIRTFTVGGVLSLTGRNEDAYIGDSIRLVDLVDSYGSYLTYIYMYTPDNNYNPIYPIIQLTDPNGDVYTMEYPWYYIPVYAPLGIYDVHAEWDTGEPYQGLLTADSQFEVLPQQTSEVISPDGGELYSPWDDTLYQFPPGAFTEPVTVTHTVRYVDIPDYSPLLGIEHFYDVSAVYVSTGLPAEPTMTYTVTIGYDDWQRGVVSENSLQLNYWDGSEWVLESSGVVDPINNQLIATPDHFSTWGILGETNQFFLPLLNRK